MNGGNNYGRNENRTLYRVQGANLGYPSILISDSYRIKSYKAHLFVSGNLTHHKYYINKRIKQVMKRALNEDGNIYDTECGMLKHLCDALINLEVEPISLIEFPIFDIMFRLLGENSIMPKQDHRRKSLMPRKIDVERYGGGFHLSKLWLKLFCDSLVFIKYRNIKTIDMANFLRPYIDKNIQKFGEIDCANIRFQVHDFIAYNPIYNKEYGLDTILRDLKTIISEGAFIEGTSLDRNPHNTMDHFMYCVEMEKKRALQLIKKR